MENLKKLFLSIFALVLMVSNFSTAEASGGDAFIYYGNVRSFIDKVDAILNETLNQQFNTNYRLSGGRFVGDKSLGIYPIASDGSIIRYRLNFGSNNSGGNGWVGIGTLLGMDDNNISIIEFHFPDASDISEEVGGILGASIVATGVSESEYGEFFRDVQKFANETHYRSSKTFKIWNSKMGRYIVVKFKVVNQLMFPELEVTITGKYR